MDIEKTLLDRSFIMKIFEPPFLGSVPTHKLNLKSLFQNQINL